MLNKKEKYAQTQKKTSACCMYEGVKSNELHLSKDKIVDFVENATKIFLNVSTKYMQINFHVEYLPGSS